LKPYRFLDDADQEFHEQIGYYLGVSMVTAAKFVDEVHAAVHDVREFPRSGSPISSSIRQRVLATFEFSVLYADLPGEIVVVAIAPHRRRPGYWRKRLRALRR
jgi:plasmid stabilization system protein ParE